MKRYTILLLVSALAVGAGACASAGGGAGGPQESNPADEWTGPTPENDLWTRSAALYLARATENPDPEAKRNLYEQALESVQEGTQNAPSNPRIWFLGGQLQVKVGDYFRADSMFDRAEELYPYYEEVEQERRNAWVQAYNAGVSSLQSGNVEDARQQLERAAIIYQGRPGAHLQLGSIYARQGQTDNAIEAFRSALEIMRGEAADELSEEERAQWQENEQVAAFNLAQLLAQAGHETEAADAYRDFLERNPDHTPAKINLAVVLTRQGNVAEATEIYNELLQRTDLSDDQYVMAGIGLFRGEDYVRAADAFRTALELNPYSRDALYNLAQALYLQSRQLEDRVADPDSDRAEEAELNARLVDLYEETRQVSEKLQEMDPYNRNVLAILARSYRGLADQTEDVETSDEWREMARAALERHEEMPVQLTEVRLSPGEEQVTVRGQIENLNVDAGTPIQIRFTLLGEDGSSVGTTDATLTAPEAETAEPFQFTVPRSGEVAGWRYEPLD